MNDRFATFANRVSQWTGKPVIFICAVGLLITWALCGPITGFSQQWQLIVNTGTTILTFLMVFIIQNTQNRHTSALQIKLDEVIRALRGAKNNLIDLENLTEAELNELQERFSSLGKQAREGKCAAADPVQLPASHGDGREIPTAA